MQSKSENLAQIFGYQTGAVTNLPPLQESRPEIPRVEGGRGENMTTRVFHDLLDPTMIYLFIEHKLTNMTCQWGKEQKIAQGDRQVFSKGWRYELCPRP